MKTPRVDAAMEESGYEADPHRGRILALMSSEICKDSYTELCEMTFAEFHHLEAYIALQSLREAERAHARYLMQKHQ